MIHPYIYAGLKYPPQTIEVYYDIVVSEASKVFGIDKETIKGDSRKQNVVVARQCVEYALYRICKMKANVSDVAIAKMLQRDRTNHYNSIDKVEFMMQGNDKYSDIVKSFIKKIKQKI